jgi:hypothetical protein
VQKIIKVASFALAAATQSVIHGAIPLKIQLLHSRKENNRKTAVPKNIHKKHPCKPILSLLIAPEISQNHQRKKP